MHDMLQGLDIEIAGLMHLGLGSLRIDERGNHPLENARIKALAYYDILQSPVFSCDSGLFIEGLSNKLQPGVHIRRVNGQELTDEEMLDYYSSLAASLGGKVKAWYKNAICLVLDSQTIYQYDGTDMASEAFYIVSQPHHMRIKGFPLDSLSVHCKKNRYYLDLKDDSQGKYGQAQTNGFRRFFQRVMDEHYHELPKALGTSWSADACSATKAER